LFFEASPEFSEGLFFALPDTGINSGLSENEEEAYSPKFRKPACALYLFAATSNPPAGVLMVPAFQSHEMDPLK
jgi:hypothetical protein